MQTETNRRDYPVAYALVLTSEDCPLTRFAHGLWPAGFQLPAGFQGCGHGDIAPRVVAIVVDSGSGRDADSIRAALDVTYLDEAYRVTIDDSVGYIVSNELDLLAADATGSYYALVTATGEMREDFPSQAAALRWLAERTGIARTDLVLEDRSSSAGSEIRHEVSTARYPDGTGGEHIGTVGSEPTS